jgi:ribosome maturation factor RimP
MKVETKVENAIDSIVKEQGFEIEYVEFVKEGSNNVLRVVIDKPNEKMWVDDCEIVSRAIEDTVDKNIEQEYVLEVSSPGLERQLKTIRLYKKYIGKEAHVKLYKKLDDLKEFNELNNLTPLEV